MAHWGFDAYDPQIVIRLMISMVCSRKHHRQSYRCHAACRQNTKRNYTIECRHCPKLIVRGCY